VRCARSGVGEREGRERESGGENVDAHENVPPQDIKISRRRIFFPPLASRPIVLRVPQNKVAAPWSVLAWLGGREILREGGGEEIGAHEKWSYDDKTFLQFS